MLPTNFELGGRYRIVEFLSQGGFGAVYRALDPVLNRPVAIKMLTLNQAEVAPERQRAMLRAEAQTLARLDHPHILKIHDLYVPDEGNAYIIMALAEGKSLDLLIGQAILSEAYAERLFIQVCQAVDFAHDKGVLHLDIKPKNILLDGTGNALLADFGIARVLQDVSRIKAHPQMGTPVYMPPEQRDGGMLGRYSDVYTLGVTLHEMLAGTRPIRLPGDKAPTLELSSALPAPVRAVIACATENDPARRYRSAGELAAALIDVLHPEQALAADHARATARSRQQQELARLEQRLAELQSRTPSAPTELSGAPVLALAESPSALDALAMAETQAAIAALRTRILADTSTEPANPYRGLDPFEAADADRFFGREAIVETLAERLGERRLVAVLGPSGSGKSSLVLAGLLPQLQRGALPGVGSWLVRTLRPGAAPLRVLATTIALLTGRRGDQALALEDAMRRDERVLEAELRLLMAEAAPRQRLLMVVDQFEEVFTQCSDEQARRMFLANLLYASQDGEGSTAFVLTMRADHYGDAAAYPSFAARLSANHLLVGPLSAIELRRAIEEPARLAGVVYAPGVVDVIIDDVIGRPGALPLLQQALTETWLIRQGRVISLADYRASGGVAGALAGRAQHEYAQLTTEQQGAADRLLLRLVQPGDGADDTRRRAPLAEVVSGSDGDLVRAIIERFTARQARLLTATENPGLGATVELTHETLIMAWPRLHELLRDHRDSLRTHRRLTEASGEWERNAHDATYLYSGAQLFAAREWAEINPASLNEREQAFLAASLDAADAARRSEEQRREKERRQNRWLRIFAFAVSALAIAAVIAGYLANTQRLAAEDAQQREEQARISAESQSLAVQAQIEASRDPDLALLLAIEGARRGNGPLVEEALRRAIEKAPITLRGHYGPVYNLAISPDSKLIAAAGDQAVEVWSLETKRRVIALISLNQSNYPLNYYTIAFSSDGSLLAAGTDMGQLIVWRVADWTELYKIEAHKELITGISIHPDSTKIVVASHDQTATVWDGATGAKLQTLRGHNAAVQTATFSPEGDFIATGSWDTTIKLWDATDGTLLRTFEGHSDIIRSVTFSPDGKRIASGGLDQSIKIWDVATGALAFTLSGHTSRVTRVLFSADGTQLFSASGDQTVKVWSSASGEELQTFHGHEDSVTSLVLTEHGGDLFSSGVDGQLQKWDLATGSGEQVVAMQGASIIYLAFSRDGSKLVTTSTGWTARVWDALDGKLLLTLRGHNAPVASAEFDPEGKRILTSGTDAALRVWDAETGAELASFTVAEAQGNIHAIFSPDGDTIAVSVGTSILLLDAQTLQPIRSLATSLQVIWRIAFSPDGVLLAAIGTQTTGGIEILDVASGERATGYKFFYPWPLMDLAFSPDGVTLAMVSTSGETLLWDMQQRKLRQKLTTMETYDANRMEVISGGEGLNTVAYSGNGQYLLTGSYDGAIRVWDAAQGVLVQELRGHGNSVYDATFSPDSRTIASGDLDGTVKIWQLGSRQEQPGFDLTSRAAYGLVSHPAGEQVLVVGEHGATLWNRQTGEVELRLPGAFTAGDISPDGKHIVTVMKTRGLVNIWDASSGEKRALQTFALGSSSFGVKFSPDGSRIAVFGFHGSGWVLAATDLAIIAEIQDTTHVAHNIVFSPDGQRVLVAKSMGTAHEFNAANGELLRTFRMPADLTDARYSPDGSSIVMALGNRSVVVADVATGVTRFILNGHRALVASASFSPDGQLIISASFDGTAKLWDATTGELRSTLWVHNRPLADAAFSPDGQSVVVLGLEGSVRQFYVGVEDLRTLAEALVSRDFTPEERARYLGEAPVTATTLP
jgi:WD40 repeat protein